MSGKALGAKTTKSATTQSVARRRRRHKCQTSEKILAILTITAFILSVAPILFHSHNSSSSSELHKNGLKGSLDNFVQQKSASSARAATTNIQDTSLKKGKNGQQQQHDDELHNNHHHHPVAHLNCVDHGGPTDPNIIDEMVYWSDIPTDANYLSPMHPLNDPYTPNDIERFLTFEPDQGGFNNIRMAMETALVMAHAMGRTLVLPPEYKLYNFESTFGLKDFFHFDAIAHEHAGFKVITMEEFLVQEGVSGKMVEYGTNNIVYPPKSGKKKDKEMDWNLVEDDEPLYDYLRKVGNDPNWSPYECALAIPSSTEPEAVEELKVALQSILDGSESSQPTLEEFNSNPTPVDAPMVERMREMIADKGSGEEWSVEQTLCLYDKPMQEAKLVHLKSDDGARFLTHFYAFIFFADWRQDLWSKRFVRDHLRYADDIMCAAARVVEAVREHARKNKSYMSIMRNLWSRLGGGRNEEGIYDALHIRRGDFLQQFPDTQLSAEELYEVSKGELYQGSTLYIATDERDLSFFKPFIDNYDVVFLNDFLDVIPEVNTNFYGMIDQLVAYKSRVFFGTWSSTLSGYVNRMRGYYITKHKLEGYKDGSLPSYYFMPEGRVNDMRQYKAIMFLMWVREFPISWRDIDKGIKEIANSIQEAISPAHQQNDGIFVITLQGTPNADTHNEGRLDSFKEAWKKSCGTDPEIHVCPGVMDDRRGYGLTRSWLNCLQMARQMDLEVTMVFEDDARLFDKELSLNFCDAGQRHSKVWKDLPEDTFLAFLGGHTWTYADQDEKKQERLGSQPSQYLETTFSYGTYGFAVPRQSLDTLLNTIEDDLAHGFIDEEGVRQAEFLSPEKSWYRKAREVGKKIYAIHPLAVWHEGGFSNTWKMDRESITGEEEDDESGSEGGIRGVAT